MTPPPPNQIADCRPERLLFASCAIVLHRPPPGLLLSSLVTLWEGQEPTGGTVLEVIPAALKCWSQEVLFECDTCGPLNLLKVYSPRARFYCLMQYLHQRALSVFLRANSRVLSWTLACSLRVSEFTRNLSLLCCGTFNSLISKCFASFFPENTLDHFLPFSMARELYPISKMAVRSYPYFQVGIHVTALHYYDLSQFEYVLSVSVFCTDCSHFFAVMTTLSPPANIYSLLHSPIVFF